MKNMNIVRVIAGGLLLLAAGLFIGGCASTPVAPAYNIYGYKRIAIVPFTNNTHDPELAAAAQEQMLSELLSLRAMPVITAPQVAAYLKKIKANAADVATDDALRKKIAANFKCDVIMTGACEGYAEFLKDTPPERLLDPETKEPVWGFYTNRKVVVDTSASLMDAESGAVVWSNKGNGYSWLNTWNPLPVPGNVTVPDEVGKLFNFANLVANRINKKTDKEPLALDGNPDGGLIYPKSRAFMDLRSKAIYQSVSAMTDDFRGRKGWKPGTAVTK